MLTTIAEQQPFEAPESLIDSSFVCYIGEDSGAVDAERVGDNSKDECLEAHASALDPPLNIAVDLPSGRWQPGQSFCVQGPQGPICLQIPVDAVPGGRLVYKIAPRPEFRVEVPPGAGPGWVMTFQRDDGGACVVTVPAGLQPGDTFEVTPPALMVRVPETAQPGDFVRFCRMVSQENDHKAGSTEFFRARVPEGLKPCMYFAARLPLKRSTAKVY
mmetsp:Transcript_98034/g.282780  ORF Transcript_98034/g.282780 Transcript_98034/m.282780 type:complete len:216 (-) Transcript_98034:206-853(-)